MMTVALLLAPLSTTHAVANERVKIAKVYDGDTVTLSDGSRLRLIQIDAPELASNECFAEQSRDTLKEILESKKIRLIYDARLEKIDKYGRKLGYLFVGKINVNLMLVEMGAATPYFYGSSKGIYATELLKAAQNAQINSRGLWRVCPGTKLNPYSAAETSTQESKVFNGSCDPNYEGCIPANSPDLNCPDIRRLGKSPIKIIGNDVHRLDHDRDGYGCE